MYRHDPSVMLYAPLRAVIYIDAASVGSFCIRRCMPQRDSTPSV
jgi:hypothetical protein